MKLEPESKLELGHFYRDRMGRIWCVYSVDFTAEAHFQAMAIRVVHSTGAQTEYFFSNGKYAGPYIEHHLDLVESV